VYAEDKLQARCRQAAGTLQAKQKSIHWYDQNFKKKRRN
jgi:hypothetical protein